MEILSLLVKPVSGRCNMRCRYCFYKDEINNRSSLFPSIMSEDTVENIIKKSLAYSCGRFSIAFQGGEPTLAGISFYKKINELIEQYNINSCEISYSLQTNGYALNDEWADFFKKNNYLIGISLDGIEKTNDAYRVDTKENGSFDRIMESIELLKKYEVDFNVLTVVNNETALHGSEIYDFYKENGIVYQQYIECIEPIGTAHGEKEYSLSDEKYLVFLKSIFDRWYNDLMNGRYVYIRYFENLIMSLAGKVPEQCSMRGECSKQWVIESDGSVYPCDFYVLDKWKLGNLNENDVPEIERKREELKFIEESQSIPNECMNCKWYRICRNGCRRYCGFKSGRDVNCFCNVYKEFFDYSVNRIIKVMQKYGVI